MTHTFAIILIGVLAVAILAAVWHVAGPGVALAVLWIAALSGVAAVFYLNKRSKSAPGPTA